MAKLYLIDGNNLIGHSSDMSLKDPACRTAAVTRLSRFCRDAGVKATIVFDGGPDEQVGEGGLALGPVRAILAGRGKDADTRILEIINRYRGKSGLAVVSSDRSIYGHARRVGLTALRIHEFNRVMAEAGRSNRLKREEEKELEEKSRSLSSGEIDEWLRLFSENNGNETADEADPE